MKDLRKKLKEFYPLLSEIMDFPYPYDLQTVEVKDAEQYLNYNLMYDGDEELFMPILPPIDSIKRDKLIELLKSHPYLHWAGESESDSWIHRYKFEEVDKFENDTLTRSGKNRVSSLLKFKDIDAYLIHQTEEGCDISVVLAKELNTGFEL